MKPSFLILAALLASCVSNDLPGDLEYVELSSGNHAIVRSDGAIIVYPNVPEYEVRGSLVVGKRTLATDNSDYSEPFSSGLGYFILDTRTGKLQQGLEAKAVTNRTQTRR